jgi:hypothetical protein
VTFEQGLIPARQQVAGHSARPHQVDWTVAHDLIGDRNVAAPRVPNVRDFHG